MMADKQTVLRLLKTARGQLDGIIKMVEDDRYCICLLYTSMAIWPVSPSVSSVMDHAPEDSRVISSTLQLFSTFILFYALSPAASWPPYGFYRTVMYSFSSSRICSAAARAAS